MGITSIKDYLETLYKNQPLDRNLKLSRRELEFMKGIGNAATERDKSLIDNLNPSKDYCVLSIGKLHVPSAVNRLQKLGYRAKIFVPKAQGTLADVVAYEKQKEEIREGFEKTRGSAKEALVIADVHTMIYSLEGVLKEPEELQKEGIKEVSICMEHSRPGNANNFLYKDGKHCFHVYDELRDYAERCKGAGIALELVGLECREDGKEIC